MGFWSRRQWLRSAVAAVVGGHAVAQPTSAVPGSSPGPAAEEHKTPLGLSEFQPKSMLHVPETKVPRSKFPVIDVHTHLSFQAAGQHGVGLGEKMKYPMPPEEVLAVMNRKNIRTMVDLTGGHGQGLIEVVAKWQTAYPGRFVVFTEPWWERSNEPGYAQFQADEIERAHQAGAKGLKVVKTLGLYLRENVTSGNLVKLDDRRFDPMWEACGALGMPVAIHTSDPDAFFLPIDRFNERFEELNNHPSWSFYGRDFPGKMELLEARNRVFARHPRNAIHCPARWEPGRRLGLRFRVPRPLAQHARGDGRAAQRTRPAAASVAQVFREVPGPHHDGNGRGPARHGDSPADFRR